MCSDVRIDVRSGQNGNASFFSASTLSHLQDTATLDAPFVFTSSACGLVSAKRILILLVFLARVLTHFHFHSSFLGAPAGLGSRNTRASSIVCATRSLRYSSRPSLFGPEPRNWSLRFVPAITLSPGLYVRVQHGKGGMC